LPGSGSVSLGAATSAATKRLAKHARVRRQYAAMRARGAAVSLRAQHDVRLLQRLRRGCRRSHGEARGGREDDTAGSVRCDA
jgi:hypothetical protein